MDRQTIDIVQELLADEQASAVLRLTESTAFVSPSSAAQASAIRRIADEINEHAAWLVDLLSRAGRSPGPRIGDLRTADLHFQEVAHTLPRVIRDIEHLLRLCERAGSEVADDAQVATVIARMADRHRKHLETLQALSHPVTGDAAPTPSGTPAA